MAERKFRRVAVAELSMFKTSPDADDAPVHKGHMMHAPGTLTGTVDHVQTSLVFASPRPSGPLLINTFDRFSIKKSIP